MRTMRRAALAVSFMALFAMTPIALEGQATGDEFTVVNDSTVQMMGSASNVRSSNQTLATMIHSRVRAEHGIAANAAIRILSSDGDLIARVMQRRSPVPGPNRVRGKRCGMTCINRNYTCRTPTPMRTYYAIVMTPRS